MGIFFLVFAGGTFNLMKIEPVCRILHLWFPNFSCSYFGVWQTKLLLVWFWANV